MSITVSVTGNTPDELKAHIAWLADKLGATSMMTDIIKTHIETKPANDPAPAVVEEAVSKIETVINAAVAVEKTVSKAKDKAAKTVEPSDVAAPADVTVTPKVLQDLAGEVSILVGSPKVKEVIASFGGSNIKAIPAEKYADLYAAIKALK
jgi:hypothetical protein